ncbi:hypothetical protein MTR67_005892 [Solanum verrucosum]|uniref:Uncharacterized protein n=1 Tax=Solanum verrucosum TaxID=315347 RepID=A0AAF0PX75_SOLVR|nr:hypothetical protein MTR67_005892 [Solanum verrucosum]
MKRGKSRQYIIILVDFGAQFKIRPKGGTYFSIAKRELENLSLYRSTTTFSTISDKRCAGRRRVNSAVPDRRRPPPSSAFSLHRRPGAALINRWPKAKSEWRP